MKPTSFQLIKQHIPKAAYYALVGIAIIFCVNMVKNALAQTDWHDFDVFVNSANLALAGKSIYVVSGNYNLPFWYFPWTAWFYIPFAIWPREIGLALYIGLSIVSLLVTIYQLAYKFNPKFNPIDTVFILAMVIPMNLLMIIVGQMDYLLLGLAVIVIYAIDKKNNLLAGLLFPLLWIKPHLFIVFTLFAFWRAGKRTIITNIVFSAAMFLLQTLLHPRWLFEMLELLQAGTQRTKSVGFTTLPNVLGSQENWVGTANLPFTILLIILALVIVWRFRSLPTVPLLSLSLAASLFCAPRAHSYDLALIIPAMLWLSAEKFKPWIWLWIAGAIIPMLASYSTNSYLLTLLVFALGIWKAEQMLRSEALNHPQPRSNE